MSPKDYQELDELQTRLFKEVEIIKKAELKRGNRIEIVEYKLTPNDYEILVCNINEFKSMKEGTFVTDDGISVKPNIGGYPVIVDQTIDRSTIRYTT